MFAVPILMLAASAVSAQRHGLVDIAPQAQVTSASGSNSQGDGVAALNDGSLTTSWKSADGWLSTAHEFVLKWPEQHRFKEIQIYIANNENYGFKRLEVARWTGSRWTNFQTYNGNYCSVGFPHTFPLKLENGYFGFVSNQIRIKIVNHCGYMYNHWWLKEIEVLADSATSTRAEEAGVASGVVKAAAAGAGLVAAGAALLLACRGVRAGKKYSAVGEENTPITAI